MKQRRKEIKLLKMSKEEQDDYKFIDNQKKKLVLLKNIAERLHGK